MLIPAEARGAASGTACSTGGPEGRGLAWEKIRQPEKPFPSLPCFWSGRRALGTPFVDSSSYRFLLPLLIILSLFLPSHHAAGAGSTTLTAQRAQRAQQAGCTIASGWLVRRGCEGRRDRQKTERERCRHGLTTVRHNLRPSHQRRHDGLSLIDRLPILVSKNPEAATQQQCQGADEPRQSTSYPRMVDTACTARPHRLVMDREPTLCRPRKQPADRRRLSLSALVPRCHSPCCTSSLLRHSMTTPARPDHLYTCLCHQHVLCATTLPSTCVVYPRSKAKTDPVDPEATPKPGVLARVSGGAGCIATCLSGPSRVSYLCYHGPFTLSGTRTCLLTPAAG